MQAATYGHDRVLEQLLVFGAVPDTGDSDKNTALHEACLIGNYDTVSILLEYNAQINIRNKDGRIFCLSFQTVAKINTFCYPTNV